MKRNWSIWSMILRQAEGGGAGGTPPADVTATPPAETGTVLFPNDPAKTEDKPEDKTPPADAGEWKPYVDDPAKSAEENAAAKAEHDKGDPASPLNQVPADGKYEFVMPEGVTLDAELAGSLMPEFKDLGLTQGQAQKLVDRYIAHQQAQAEKYVSTPEGAASAAAYEYFKEHGTPDKWAEAAKADKEIGGSNWDATVQAATRAVNTLGDAGLKQFLNASGAGNHPALIKAFAKAGAMIAEDVPAHGGGGGAGKPVDAASVLFPDDAKN